MAKAAKSEKKHYNVVDSTSYTGRQRVRRSFGDIREIGGGGCGV